MTEPTRTGGLEVIGETVLVELPRPRSGEALRLTRVRARAPDGREVSWVAVRLYFRDSRGALRPSKAGITLRVGELAAIGAALTKASVTTPAAAGAHHAVPARQEQLPGTRGRRTDFVPFEPPPPPIDDGFNPDEHF